MKTSRKYVLAVALLVVLAVAFGVFATVAPPLTEDSGYKPRQESSSESVGHFQNPPTYDSSWLDITDKCGEHFNVTHNVNSTDIIVDIRGKISSDGGPHQRYLGGTGYTPGWSRTYGGTNNDYGYSVIQTADGGYVLVGDTMSFGAGSRDCWLVKTDQVGNVQWSKTYGGTNEEHCNSALQTDDGGYAMAANTLSFGVGYSDFWLVKTDSTGNHLWNKTYDNGASGEGAPFLVQTVDGGYAMAGHTEPSGGGDIDFWLVKTDSAGNEQWNKTFDATIRDHVYALVQTRDGGYAIAGIQEPSGPSSRDFWLVKTDSGGNHLWNQTYGGGNEDWPLSMVQTSDEGYAIAGFTWSFGVNRDAWLVKTNSTGHVLWSQTYGGTGQDLVDTVVQTMDGGYAMAGQTTSFGASDWDFWLVKTDGGGAVQWNKTYGGVSGDAAYHLIQTIDGGYAMTGVFSFGTEGVDFWVVKTEIESGLVWADSTNDTITLYRGRTDPFWNYVRVRIWTIQEPTWIFGDINMDGTVDAADLYILGRNYGQAFSVLSLAGIVAVAGIHTIKKRKQSK